jgi:hypothetical protein
MTTYKKPHVYLDPKTGLLTRKSRIKFVRRRKPGERSGVPSRFFKAMGDLFDIGRRKK